MVALASPSIPIALLARAAAGLATKGRSPLVARDEFARHVVDALHAYHDPVRLWTSPLIDLMGLERTEGDMVLAALRKLLRDGIASLRPQPSVPFGEPAWLGYRLLWLSHIERRDLLSTCEELAFSQASYYRHHRQAVKALTGVLWEHYQRRLSSQVTPGTEPQSAPEAADMAEAVRLARQAPRTGIEPRLLADSTAQLLMPLAERRGVTVQLDVGQALPPVYGNLTVLRQVLLNILEAALDAASPSGLLLSASLQNGEVVWRLSGLDPSRVPAAKLADSPKPRLSRALLDEYGGRAWLEELGDRYDICFAVPGLSPRRVLVIDDDADTILLYRRFLEPEYAVLVAHSWLEAQQSLPTAQPGLVLLDVLMPVEDGWTILAALRSDPRTARLPVLVCSVLDQAELALSLGATQVLQKPINPQALLRTIRAVLAEADTLR